MIISCPQCTKKFHLDDQLIPDEGFKVRCSNCSLTWRVSQPTPPSQSTEDSHPHESELENDDHGKGEDFSQENDAKTSNEFLTKLKENHPHEDNIPSSLPPFPPRMEEEKEEEKSFAQKTKLDWIVLALGILIFAFVFLLDNFYQTSFFSNLTRRDSYSYERKDEEAHERDNESDLPEYKTRMKRDTPQSATVNEKDSDIRSPLFSDRIRGN